MHKIIEALLMVERGQRTNSRTLGSRLSPFLHMEAVVLDASCKYPHRINNCKFVLN